MNADNSIASFWHSYMLAEKAPKLLSGRSVSPASDPGSDACHADEIPDDTVLDVLEYH